MNEPSFLSRGQADRWHRFSLDKYGGSDGLRSESVLESALGAPVNDYLYEQAGLFEIAAAYAFHIAQAQAYLDGNKRTAVAVALAFLQINGVPTDVDAFSLCEALVAVAERRMTKEGRVGRPVPRTVRALTMRGSGARHAKLALAAKSVRG